MIAMPASPSPRTAVSESAQFSQVSRGQPAVCFPARPRLADPHSGRSAGQSKRCAGRDGLRSRRSQGAAARALGLHGFGRGRQPDARPESRSLQTYTTPPAQTGGRLEDRHARRALRNHLGQSHLPLSRGRARHVSCRRRAWRGSRRAGQEGPADSLHRHFAQCGRRDQGARRTGLVPALRGLELGLDGKSGQASRRRRLPGGGVDHRPAGWPKYRDWRPVTGASTIDSAPIAMANRSAR